MPVETCMWRIDEGRPRRLIPSAMPSQDGLEDLLAKGPTILGDRLLVIGRQVGNHPSQPIDLLAIDRLGWLHLIQLQRGRTAGEVVAQMLESVSWASSLTAAQIQKIATAHFNGLSFEAAFKSSFGARLPAEINAGAHMVIVATDPDPDLEQVVDYLAGHGVPIQVVFFSFLRDGEREYLARRCRAASPTVTDSQPVSEPSQAVPPQKAVAAEEAAGPRETVAPQDAAATVLDQRPLAKPTDVSWPDWYVFFGDGQGRSWTDGQRYGFVSAGAGGPHSKALCEIPVNARVFVCLPQGGYAAVGRVSGPAVPFEEALVTVDGCQVRLAEQSLHPKYGPLPRNGDNPEYVLPVKWISAKPAEQAFLEKGMFTNTNRACQLSDEFTLAKLREHFGLNDPPKNPTGLPSVPAHLLRAFAK